jgi:hypothetical protein
MTTLPLTPEAEKEALRRAINTFREQIAQRWDSQIIHTFYNAVGGAEATLTIFEQRANSSRIHC